MIRSEINLYIGFAQPDEWVGWGGTYARHCQRFELAGGLPCLCIPFGHANEERIANLNPKHILMSGFARSFEEYESASFSSVMSWLPKVQIPTLAICGSHQLIGFSFNGALGSGDQLRDEPMRLLTSGEPASNPDFHHEYYMERGFYSLTLTEAGKRDPENL